jgi:GT2 family glycosyltransferase
LTNDNPLPFVSIIILNYNSLVHLQDNLDSLLTLRYPVDRLEILLVDNASTDESLQWTMTHYPVVRIVRNEANWGFAGGNNAGVQAARGEWVVILNPDMRVEPDWLAELVPPLPQDPTIACVASKVLSWDGTTIDFADAAINFMGWGCQPGYGSQRLTEYDIPKPLLFANGGAMLVKRDVFLVLGGFDTDYFAYYEDVDFGWRLWLGGYRIVFAPKAVVYHRHHGSWQHVNAAKKWVLSERNTLFTIIKNFNDENLARALPAALLLLAQRAYLDILPDTAFFDGGQIFAAPNAHVFGLRYYLAQAGQLLRHGRLRELLRRVRDEWERRRNRTAQPTKEKRPYQTPVNGRFTAPVVALARLLAAQDVSRSWFKLLEKRVNVQTNRSHSDQEILPLFQWLFISNFDDDAFIQAMNHVIERFQLDQMMDATAKPVSPELHQLSLAVARQLLQQIERAFILSEVDERPFRLGETGLTETYQIPMTSVAVLAKMNKLLWTLPDLPLSELLVWLEEGLARKHD